MKNFFLATFIPILFFGIVFYAAPIVTKKTFSENTLKEEKGVQAQNLQNEEMESQISHLKAPYPLYGAYFSSWASGSQTFRKRMDELFQTKGINAVVIDVKDSTGRIGYIPSTESLQKIGSGENRIPDIDTFIEELHKKNIYVIGRIAVFQDNYLARKRPDLALLQTGTQKPWADKHNLAWLDPGSQEVWDYAIEVANEAHKRGFDEINFDYIRFPSDGATKKYTRQFDVELPLPEVLKKFFAYADAKIGESYPISFDIFGMTTTAEDDMGIGQLYEDIIVHGDYIMPMVYPSHYGAGLFGFSNPAEHPYEVVTQAMSSAVLRAQGVGMPKEKLRTWIQDFDLGATYDSKKVVDQMNASEKAGVPSWVLWDAANTYTKEAILEFQKSKQSNP